MTIQEVSNIRGLNTIHHVEEDPGENMIEFDYELNNYGVSEAEESFFLPRNGQYLGTIINTKYDASANEFLMKVKLSAFLDTEDVGEEPCHNEILILHFNPLDANFNYFIRDYIDERCHFVPSKTVGVGIAFDVAVCVYDYKISYIVTQLQ